jgi:hypothetical protein
MNAVDVEVILKEIISLKAMIKPIIDRLTNDDIDIYESAQTNELYAALAKAQGEFPRIKVNKLNPFHKTEYGNLDAIVQGTRAPLSKYELSVLQQIRAVDNRSYVYTRLAHSSGQFIQSKYLICPLKAGQQEWGSVSTYARRYCLQALLGVTLHNDPEDDDAEFEENKLRLADPGATKINMDYDRNDESPETVTTFQLNELNEELKGLPQLCKKLLDSYNISNLSELPESLYRDVITKIRKQKQIYAKN